MAQTHRTHETEAASAASALPAANTIYMMVDGYVGLLPWRDFPSLSAAEAVAANEGRKQIALRKAQTVARKAAKDGKNVREAVNEFLASFEPDPNTEFQTIGSKRMEIARDYTRELLARNNRPSDDATVEKNAPAILASEKHGPAVDARLAAWLASYTAPTKRGTGAASGEGASVGDLDSLE